MNPVLKALRDANIRLINANPVIVIIHRVEYSNNESSGGRSKSEADLPTFTGRLVPSRRMGHYILNEAGGQQREGWTLIAPWNANLNHGSDVTDTFELDGRIWCVRRAFYRCYQGEPYAVHADVEDVS